ncbi:MAG: hypothetical protein ACI841_003637 [Planctomycetota bacterium]
MVLWPGQECRASNEPALPFEARLRMHWMKVRKIALSEAPIKKTRQLFVFECN